MGAASVPRTWGCKMQRVFRGAWMVQLLTLLPAYQALSIGTASRPSSAASNRSLVDLHEWIDHLHIREGVQGNIPEYLRDYRVVVAMTTIPPRMNREHLEPVLDAMLAQTWPIDRLYLSIPYVYSRTGETYYIPNWLRKKDGVSIQRCKDLGPGTHLLNALTLEQDSQTFIILVDDDHVYHHELVEILMRAAIVNPGSAIAAQGFLSVPGLQITKTSPRYLQDHGFPAGPVLVSYLGVIYQRAFFDDSIFNYSGVSDKCLYQDDMWFSAHLARKGISRYILNSALGVHELKELHLGPSSLTLWQEKPPRKVSEECNEALLRLYPDLWTWRPRVVLSVAGLPPLSGLDRSLSSREPSAWRQVTIALANLPFRPDLVYLCSEATATDEKPVVGAGFEAGGVTLTSSSACKAYAEDLRVYQLVRDPLQMEGDPTTVVIVGLLLDFVREGARLPELAACAVAGAKQAKDSGAASAWCWENNIGAVTIGGFSDSLR